MSIRIDCVLVFGFVSFILHQQLQVDPSSRSLNPLEVNIREDDLLAKAVVGQSVEVDIRCGGGTWRVQNDINLRFI